MEKPILVRNTFLMMAGNNCTIDGKKAFNNNTVIDRSFSNSKHTAVLASFRKHQQLEK
jgi:hypothetical protein